MAASDFLRPFSVNFFSGPIPGPARPGQGFFWPGPAGHKKLARLTALFVICYGTIVRDMSAGRYFSNFYLKYSVFGKSPFGR